MSSVPRIFVPAENCLLPDFRTEVLKNSAEWKLGLLCLMTQYTAF